MIRKLAVFVAAATLLSVPALAGPPKQFYASISLGNPPAGGNAANIWLDDTVSQADSDSHVMTACSAHKSNCSVVATGSNTCLAVAWIPGHPEFHTTINDADKQTAITGAVKACSSANNHKDCLYVWACTYGDPAKSSKAPNAD